jgi:hypothetical protein
VEASRLPFPTGRPAGHGSAIGQRTTAVYGDA